MDKEIADLVNDLREGKIDSAEFTSQLDEVADEAAQNARESTDDEGMQRERMEKVAKKARRL
jgi:hypothetical protein